ncbi:MAG: Rpn family recombination-promoting nuclease/putative transposase [Deltaproteobacteria bacterium]|nr:Rpn family recombination-promoting nuclease/putative transposase [Deltaproteobacteria bacterium]
MNHDDVKALAKAWSMEKSGTRGSDEAFYQLMQAAGDAVLRLVGVTYGHPYKLRAETLKVKKVSPDIVATPLSGQDNLVFLEFQGYADPFIRYRLLAAGLLYCTQKKHRGPFFLSIIYTRRAFRDAALPLHGLTSPEHPICQGRPKEIILEDFTEEELRDIDPRLVILAPYTLPENTPKNDLFVKVEIWGKLVREVYPKEDSKNILDLLGLFLLNRFRGITRKEVITMLNFDLAQTAAGKDILRMGVQKGRKEGRKEGKKEGIEEGRIVEARERLIDLLSARFGPFPQDVLAAIDKIDNRDILKELFMAAVKAADLATFQSKLNDIPSIRPEKT